MKIKILTVNFAQLTHSRNGSYLEMVYQRSDTDISQPWCDFVFGTASLPNDWDYTFPDQQRNFNTINLSSLNWQAQIYLYLSNGGKF